MKRIAQQPQKAYKNQEFLTSPSARLLRIMSEFLEPQARFRQQRIRDTIVFFGSARILSRKVALQQLKERKRTLPKGGKPNRKQQEDLRMAETAVEMSRYYEETVVLSRLITGWSKSLNSTERFVICSGGGPGIMEAANKGATMAGGKSIGMNISIPFEQFLNPYITSGLNFEFHYFFMRKFWFVYLAKALVVFPGGFGTFDELMEVLTLMQTGKVKKKMTIIIYGSDYWRKVLNFEEMVRLGVISRRDLKLFKFADTPEEAFYHLKKSLTANYP